MGAYYVAPGPKLPEKRGQLSPVPLTAPAPRPRCRVVIVDDHVAIIEMLQQVIAPMEGYAVVGSAENTVAALDLCRREQPDLVVLDLTIPPTSGLALLTELRAECPGAKILVFSGYLSAGSIQRALTSGAHGLVEKVGALQEFREALQAVGAGRVYFCRSSSEAVRNLVNLKPARAARSPKLSERERTVLQAIARGMSSKEIAALLNLSIHTVVNHRTRLMKKTGLRGVAQLSLYAAQIGLVDEGDRPPPAGPL